MIFFVSIQGGIGMRNRLIKKLDYKERQWLYKAIFHMIMADKTVAHEEVDELLETLKRVAGKDIDDFKAVTCSPEFLSPLKPLKGIKFDHAFIILSEIARVAAIDSLIALEEEELLKELISLLDFTENAVERVLQWTKRLAVINKQEDQLKEELKPHYLHYD